MRPIALSATRCQRLSQCAKLAGANQRYTSVRSISHIGLACRPTRRNTTKESFLQRSRYDRSYTTSVAVPQVLVNDLQSQEVLVDFNDGTATRYPAFWLRDHCPCTECTHPQTKQRQLDTFTLDPDTKAADTQALPEGLKVVWADSSHESLYEWSWLKSHVPFTANPITQNSRGHVEFVPPSGPFPSVDYEQAMNTDAGLAELLRQIRTYGLTFVDSTPPTPEATEALANRIAFVRQTHYGGFWEVVSEANPVDTAYTNLYLPNHTDTTYFTDPCGLQMFHCLSHTSSDSSGNTTGQIDPGLGGESTFVDGFAAAAKLYKTNPDMYKYLSSVRVVSHASGDEQAGSVFNNALHSAGFPVLSHLGSSSNVQTPKNLSMVRWNNSDRHSSTSFPSHHSMRAWYAAARTWNELVQSPEFEIVIKLVPGSVVVFDNWRILHGRKAFEGVRRLCGAYIGMDDFLAKGRAVEERMAKAADTTQL